VTDQAIAYFDQVPPVVLRRNDEGSRVQDHARDPSQAQDDGYLRRGNSLEALAQRAYVTLSGMPLLNTEAILSPEGTSAQKRHQLAPRRHKTLDGVRLGLLGNSKLNSDAVLVAIGDLLKERYNLESVFMRSKPTFSKPAPDEIVAEMVQNADVVVTGVGD